jgi:hypothetical protein
MLDGKIVPQYNTANERLGPLAQQFSSDMTTQNGQPVAGNADPTKADGTA